MKEFGAPDADDATQLELPLDHGREGPAAATNPTGSGSEPPGNAPVRPSLPASVRHIEKASNPTGHQVRSARSVDPILAPLLVDAATDSGLDLGAELGSDGAPSAALSRAVFRLVHRRIAARITARTELVRTLAMLGTLHAFGRPGRLTLIGPPGTGKTTSLLATAAALGAGTCPAVVFSATYLTGHGWQGADLGSLLLENVRSSGEGLPRTAGGRLTPEQVERALVLVDEVQAVGFRGLRDNAAARDHRIEKQYALLDLLGGGHLPVGDGRASGPMIDASRISVICAGVFHGLRDDGRATIEPEALVRQGLLPELVSRMGVAHRLQPISTGELVALLARELKKMESVFMQFGATLTFAPETLQLLARRIHGGLPGGPRAALAIARDAADRRLLDVVGGAFPSSAVVPILVTPDDLRQI